MAVKRWCRIAWSGAVLSAFLQADRGFRQWERRALATSMQFVRDRVDAVLGALELSGGKVGRQERCYREPSGGGQTGRARSPNGLDPSGSSAAKEVACSVADARAESYRGDFPGAGWYRVQAWEGVHPYPHANLSKLDGLRHVHIASEDEWWSWSFGVCPAPQFPDGCEGRWTMVTTDGVRHATRAACQAVRETACAR